MSTSTWFSEDQCADLEEALVVRKERAHARPNHDSPAFSRSASRSWPPRILEHSGSFHLVHTSPCPRSKKTLSFSHLPSEISARVFSLLDIRTLFLYVFLGTAPSV